MLPSWCAPRRADAVQVIGAAAALALAGAGSARIGAVLGVPAAAVRGWLRRLRSRAEGMRQDAMHQLGFIAGLAGLADPPLPALSRSPLGHALERGRRMRPRRDRQVRSAARGPVGAAGPVRPGPPPRPRPRRLITACPPGHPHARGLPATLTMTATASSALRIATP